MSENFISALSIDDLERVSGGMFSQEIGLTPKEGNYNFKVLKQETPCHSKIESIDEFVSIKSDTQSPGGLPCFFVVDDFGVWGI